MKKSNSRVFLSLFFILTIASCSHTKEVSQNCQELDWYEIGRQDGTKGLNVSENKKVKVICTDSDQSLAEALYYNGYDAGAAQYCSPENGFELGRTGQNVSPICPVMMRTSFEKSFEQGLRVATLTKENQELDKKLKSIDLTLNNESLEEARLELLKNEKITLSEKKKVLESELQALGERIN